MQNGRHGSAYSELDLINTIFEVLITGKNEFKNGYCWNFGAF